MLPCPRRAEMGLRIGEPSEDKYREDNTCSYCGSLNPDDFMTRLEAGDVALGSTDKSYKVYVHNRGGKPFLQTYRNCAGEECKGPAECTHWVTREMEQTKFYFQHLNEDQMSRFVALFNERALHFQGGFGFYVWPFFMKPAGAR